MPTTTPNLGLKKPLGHEVFNRQAYNENLDLMDQNAAKKTVLTAHLADYTQELKTDSKQSVTLPHGLSVLNAPRSAQLMPKFKGRQLVNLLGRDGNCEDLGKWYAWQSTHVLDTTNAVLGSNAIKITLNGISVTIGAIGKSITNQISPTKYYLYGAMLKVGTCSQIEVIVGSGFRALSGTITSSSYKFAYMKWQGSQNDNGEVQVRATGTNGQYGYVDGIRLYELTQAEYNEIDTLTPAQIAERYPYIDSFQCVQNPAVKVAGENLLPPFSQWSLSAKAKVVEPYKLQLDATGVDYSTSITVNALPNTKYTYGLLELRLANAYLTIQSYDKNSNILEEYSIVQNKRTFSTHVNTKYLKIIVYINEPGTFTFSNPMLVLGDKLPTEFKPHSLAHLYLQTPLYDGETLDEIDGHWVRTKKWDSAVIDNSIMWSGVHNKTGYKVFYTAPSGVGMPTGRIAGHLIKYDGKPCVFKNTEVAQYAEPDLYSYFENGFIAVSVSNAETGFGQNYTPTVDEIKAYFNGWKMYVDPENAPYNGIGEKRWGKIYSGIGTSTGSNGMVQYSGVATIPTTINDMGYTPYQLHYQLATPTTEVVPHEGELALHEGTNQIEVFEGVVVRELANPTTVINSPYYAINDTIFGSSLKNRVATIFDIFRNGNKDYKWLKNATNAYGREKTFIDTVPNFDPTAQYSVTYLALPEEFTAPLLSVDTTYDSNIKSTVGTLVDELAKVSTKTDVGFNSISNHLVDSAAHGGIQHKNILHNWDFRRNPINQRGLSVYLAAGYTIDRWRITVAAVSVNVYDGFITVKNSDTAERHFLQPIEQLLPGDYTLSAMLSSGQVFNASVYVSDEVARGVSGKNTSVMVLTPGLKVFIGDFNGYPAFKVAIEPGKSFNIAALKLELGPVSTLENDLPADYGEQLALCQRYLTSIINGFQTRTMYIGINELHFIVPIPVAMHTMPSIVDVTKLIVRTINATNQTGFTFSVTAFGSAYLRVTATKTSHGMADGQLFADDLILFSAEL